jgi:hypothetical protein
LFTGPPGHKQPHYFHVRLRRREQPPAFVDQFGWCTWDAFYRDVSHERVKEGLASFRAGGVSPRLVILDDGWQATSKRPTGEERLTALDANDKFPGGLAPTVRLAKEDFGVRTFLVWHAVIAPIVDGFAALGLADKLNGGGAVSSSTQEGNVRRVRLKDGGRFLAFCERAPKSVRLDGSPVTHRIDVHLLSVDVAAGGPRLLEIEL